MVSGLALVEQVGDGRPPEVVVVHGGLDRSSSFGRMVRLLPDVPVLRYDRRGYGRSEPGAAAGLEQQIADLAAVIGERRRVVVFGHSLGGTIALAAAAAGAVPAVRAIATYESPVPWLLPAGPEVVEAPWSSATDPGDVAERFLISMAGERVWRRLPAATRAARRAEGPALVADLAVARGGAGVDLARVDVPVLVGLGSPASPRRHAEADALVAAVPSGALVVVDGADHGLHLSAPAQAAALVRRLRALG